MCFLFYSRLVGLRVMWKRVLCVVSVISLFLQLNVSAENLKVSDWATEYYKFSNENLLLPEYMIEYDFTQCISRESFCDLVATSLKKGLNEEDNKNEHFFVDTDNENVLYLREKNIIMGKSENEFCPKDRLTREEAATIVYRTRNYVKEDNREPNDVVFYYDEDDISGWAQKAVFRLKEWGWMVGVSKEFFLPQREISVEETMKLNYYLYKNLFQQKN